MPIRPENKDRYPADWDEISLDVRKAAGWRCVCLGECRRPALHLDPVDGRCRNRQGQPAYGTRSRVVLTVGHRNHLPEDCRLENLAAWCQGCHLHYDIDHHAQTRQRTITAALEAQMEPLFPLNQ